MWIDCNSTNKEGALKRIGMLTGLVLAVGVAGAATAKTYSCKFTGNDVGKVISEHVVIRHNDSNGQVTVQDGFTNHYVGAPLPGTLKSMNATRALFAWHLPSLKDENGNWIPGIAFSVNIIRATGKASISSNPSGNYKSGRASGACTTK